MPIRAGVPVLVLCLLAVARVPSRTIAQEKPDFSGIWTAAADSAPAGGQPVRLFGQEFAVRHDGQTFSITRPMGEASMTTTHVLDGTETRSRRPGRLCEADSEFLYKAMWDGSAVRLMMVGQVPPGGGPVVKREFTWLLTLTAPDMLRVEVVPSTTSGQGPARAASTTYKRTGTAPAPPAAPSGPPVRATVAQLNWLPGVWAGTLGSSEIEERWTPAAGGSMLAISRTIRGGVMNAFEFLCIVERGGGLVYAAMPNGRQPATEFALTKIEGESLTFENPAHDFPKMIRYSRRPDGSLEAVISGDAKQKPISYVFRKQ